MKSLLNTNGLIHWSGRELERRERMIPLFASEISAFLLGQNRAWEIERTEGPVMMPRSTVNTNYTDDDIWTFRPHDETETPLAARPETTASTYAWMMHRLDTHPVARMPYCVWQFGKSFRAERDNVLKNMRLKEFHQMEFQCAYTADTANDYQQACLEPVRRMLAFASGLPARIIDSDRLPSYSMRTVDVELDTGERWMEVCSISKRTDFPVKARYQGKRGEWIEKDVLVLEIAIGIDRMVYAAGLAEERLQETGHG